MSNRPNADSPIDNVVVPYVRQSRGRAGEDSDSSLSLEQQEEAIKAWAVRNGYRVEPTIRDHDESGRSMNRPGFELAKARARPGITLAVWKYDRLARNLIGQELAVDEIEQLGANVVSITEPPGKLPRQLMGSIAEYYSDQLSERLVAIRAASARRGDFVGGIPPMGYRRAKVELITDRRTGEEHERRTGPLEVDPEYGPTVVELFDRYHRGEGLWTIARDLNARGIRRQQGGPWQTTIMVRALRNPMYRGYVQHKDVGEVKGAHPALVEDAIWFAVQERLGREVRVKHAKAHDITSWAEGLVRHVCGARMYLIGMQSRGVLYPNFWCRSNGDVENCGYARRVTSAPKLEAAIRACLAADLSSITTLDEAVAHAERAAGSGDACRQRVALQDRRRIAERRRDRARESWLMADDDQRNDELAAWQREQQAYREALQSIEAEERGLPESPDPGQYQAAAAVLGDLGMLIARADLDDETLRGILDAVGLAIVEPAGVRIEYRTPFRDYILAPLFVGL